MLNDYWYFAGLFVALGAIYQYLQKMLPMISSIKTAFTACGSGAVKIGSSNQVLYLRLGCAHSHPCGCPLTK